MDMDIQIKTDKVFDTEEVINIYRLNEWSSADKPQELIAALSNSHSLVTAFHNNKLIGIGNAISDGHLVVYYPHLIVHPDYQGKGIGKRILDQMQTIYGNFHQQMLTADGKAIEFYKKNGFERAGQTESMWIYKGNEH